MNKSMITTTKLDYKLANNVFLNFFFKFILGIEPLDVEIAN